MKKINLNALVRKPAAPENPLGSAERIGNDGQCHRGEFEIAHGEGVNTNGGNDCTARNSSQQHCMGGIRCKTQSYGHWSDDR